MHSRLDQILDVLLQEMQRGKSIKDCLKEYPEFAEELEPLLRLAGGIEKLPKPEPNPEAVESVLTKIRQQVVHEEQRKRRFSFKQIFSLQPALIRVVAVVSLIIIAGWTSMSLSARSVPGDFLYSMKLFTEKVQYILTINPEGKVELHLVFADKRTDELTQSFKVGEEVNKELLSAMLNEIQSAYGLSTSLPAECYNRLVEKIEKCNQYQMKTLEKIKLQVRVSDTSVMNEAINLCIARDHCCCEHCLNPEFNNEECTCRCWEKRCDWK